MLPPASLADPANATEDTGRTTDLSVPAWTVGEPAGIWSVTVKFTVTGVPAVPPPAAAD